MRCPVCGDSSNRVTDSRDGPDGRSIRRRRQCNACGHRFTTRERIEGVLPNVIKRDGTKEAFDRGKLLRAIEAACGGRQVTREQQEDVVQSIQSWCATREDKDVPVEELGLRTMHHLYALDPVAFVRYVAVIRPFESIDEFARILRELEKAEHVDAAGQRTLFELLAEQEEASRRRG